MCWYEVTGSAHHVTKVKSSEMNFKLSMKNNAFSWTDTPVLMMAKTTKKGKMPMVKNKPIIARRGVKGNSWSSIRMIQSSFKPIYHDVRWISVFLEFQF